MLTPVEIANIEFKRSFRGYNEEEVDDFLKQVVEAYEYMYRENTDLSEKVKLYQEQLSRYKSIEDTLNATLITAQSAAEDTCTAANKKAKIIVEEAQLQSKHIVDETNNRIIELRKEYDNLVREFKVFRNRFKTLIKEEMKTIDDIFYDVDDDCKVPFREFNYIKDDIEDTKNLFIDDEVDEEAVEEETVVANEEVVVDEEATEEEAVIEESTSEE